ncbi:5'-3' exonuclease [Listeria floridensis FSL S10-1187]|uniref:5'-3' exonuclease n=1 Tax=Listeria floridensis FSL S10-1187 TaxID=1265817 RepID=A0ABN0RGF3_9LIST|nr:5'-3' exonuclease [Listeria floridensis]EUJ32977.1 5'-3' exonuclease [Listeria floridensis FSL S10-1187]
MKNNQPGLLVIDGMALLFRAFYATAVSNQFMYNEKGLPTNGVQGMMRHIFAAIRQNEPSHAVICWDMGAKTFRNELFDGYKAGRKAPPEEMIPQFDLAKEVAGAFGFVNIGVPGYEADDCIGTITMKLTGDLATTVLSGDKDLLQLIEPRNDVWIMQKGYGNYKRYDEATFFAEMGITPAQFVDVKALMGDPSDGYPGVRGIGEKTALKLIQEFDSIEGIMTHLEELKPGQQKKIQEDAEMLALSRKLAKIHTDVPLSLDFDQMLYREMGSETADVIHHYGLRTLERDFLL